jgi:putative membrane protein
VELISLLIGTLILRPYVFIFLALFLIVASQQIGWKRTLLWTITGYLVAFAAEFSSIHNGFPFGDYYYVDTTRNQELWIAGVPFMDSLSFAFLTFTGYTCAWQLVAAWKGKNGPLGDVAYQTIRRSPVVLVLGALITTWMDLIIDPVALMGDRWFLGQIHGWPHGGEYFGVPLTNFAGWYLVTAVTIGVNQAIDARLGKSTGHGRLPGIPYMHLGGFALFVFIVGFNLFMTAWLREWTLFFAGLPLALGFLLISWRILTGLNFFTPYLAEPVVQRRKAGLPQSV